MYSPLVLGPYSGRFWNITTVICSWIHLCFGAIYFYRPSVCFLWNADKINFTEVSTTCFRNLKWLSIETDCLYTSPSWQYNMLMLNICRIALVHFSIVNLHLDSALWLYITAHTHLKISSKHCKAVRRTGCEHNVSGHVSTPAGFVSSCRCATSQFQPCILI